MNYRFGNAQHIGARQQQQDSFGFSDSADDAFSAHAGFLAVVADGMGGLAHGDAASRTAVRSFLQNYKAKSEGEPIPQALDRAVRAANVDVNTLAASLGQSGEMGTTLVAAAMLGDGLYWVSCGDSAIFLLRDGDLTLLNTQHVYARILDECAARGEISNEEAVGDPQREALTSHLGQPEMSEVDLSSHPFALRTGDTLLLASDGLFKTIPESEIATLAADGGNVQAACERLIAAVLQKQRRGQDNVTVVALAYGEAAAVPLPQPPAQQLEKTQVRDRAKESLAVQQMAARAAVESRLAVAPPPRKINAWKVLVPALIFVAVVAAAGFYSWTCCAAPPAGPPAKEPGAAGYDLNKLPPSKPGSDGKRQSPQEFEPLQPGAVEPAKPSAVDTAKPTAAPPKAPPPEKQP